MRTYLTLTREVDRGKIQKREKASRDFLERRRLMAIRLRADGKTPPEVCEILAVHQCSLRNWVNAFNKKGLDGLKTQEKRAGRKRMLSIEQISLVCKWLDEGPSEQHGCLFWTGKHLSNAIDEAFGIKYSESGIYVLLKDMGYTRLVPKTHHHKADPEKAAEFKKNSPQWSRR